MTEHVNIAKAIFYTPEERARLEEKKRIEANEDRFGVQRDGALYRITELVTREGHYITHQSVFETADAAYAAIRTLKAHSLNCNSGLAKYPNGVPEGINADRNCDCRVNEWQAIATIYHYKIWTRLTIDGQIFVVSGDQPTITSGGYFTIAAAVKVKGFPISAVK